MGAKSFIGTPEMQTKTFVPKDKLNFTIKKKVNVTLQDGGIHTKLINISTVTYSRLLTMVSF